MGAICGIFSIDGKKVSEEVGLKMMDKISSYHVDKVATWKNREIFFGCAVQYITPESKFEKLPYFDKVTNLAITADAIIDNRTEIFTLFNVPKLEWDYISDSQLILMAYKKWEEKCPKYLVGDFAFAIWDGNKKELFCARDQTGNRTFYFYHSSNIFAFCTLAKPLFSICQEGKVLNDRWIANFLSLEGPMHEIDSNETVYKDIKQLLPAYTIRINYNKMVKKQYWDPLNLPKVRFKSDEEYNEAFKKIFFEAVHCRLRSIGPIGIKMSGGLDSGSVACVAAQKLASEGKRLQAFSAIPFPDYVDYLYKDYIANETEYIEAICKKHKNIDVTYCNSEGKNSFTNVDEYLEFLEQPYKFFRNFFWINEIESIASKRGCSVLLDGQNGNFTISFGDIGIHLITLYKKVKLLSIHKEITEFCKFYNYKYFHVLKVFIKMILPNCIKTLYKKIRGKSEIKESIAVVNPEFKLRWKVDEYFKKLGIGSYQRRYYDLEEARKMTVDPTVFSQMGGVDTKVSLKYGVISRDPTRDKRVIEFCLGIPEEQYVRKGRERYLIRRAMKEILPDKVRLNYDVRGTQNADWVQRLVPIWREIQKETKELVEDKELRIYLDMDKIKKALNDIGDSMTQSKESSVKIIITSLIFKHFISMYKKEVY
ncbi:asparagine synthase-related protein [Clostridium drakei]|uniref:asparagine synthase (glutamine-hydrolyzing) n=1 Tax=Clostridium drakei TaxID=332101 RepID=A0A2U8DVG0_9CLOT|nr:asparagine synthase-related protein [Clostridium drakei]AWI06375.1 asparagine synthetase B [Clostridium drakei]